MSVPANESPPDEAGSLAHSAAAMPAPQARHLPWQGAPILDVYPVQAPWGDALVLTDDGGLHGLQLDTGASQVLMRVVLPSRVLKAYSAGMVQAGLRLHASPDGAHAAIVQDSGAHGVLLAVNRKLEVCALYGGNYHANTVPFSACFARHAGRDVLVCRSDWNRLYVLDAASGELLTEREVAYGKPHYLNHFHGGLLLNPDGTRLLDDGWVWQPDGVSRSWLLTNWLESNPWEPEDGPSAVMLDWRDGWNYAAVWLDETHAAMWNLRNGEDDDCEGHVPGLTIWPVNEGEWPPKQKWPMPGLPEAKALFRLGERLAVVTGQGTHWWRIADRTHLGDWPGCVAQAMHGPRQSLLSWDAQGVTVWPVPGDLV